MAVEGENTSNVLMYPKDALWCAKTQKKVNVAVK